MSGRNFRRLCVLSRCRLRECFANRRRPPTLHGVVLQNARGLSWTEYTYRANEEDFGKIEFRQRVAVDITERSTASTMVGQAVRMPVAIAPTGLAGMQHADGEILAARAAQKFGVPFTLSTMSICPIEAVAEATARHPFWFQLYVLRDRSFVEGLIERAGNANCSALVVTMDLQVFGHAPALRLTGRGSRPGRPSSGRRPRSATVPRTRRPCAPPRCCRARRPAPGFRASSA